MNDRVHGTGFAYHCRIGFHEYERHIQQRLLIDFEAETEWRSAAREDAVRDLVDYFEVNRALTALIEGRDWQLIEAVAEATARVLCLQFPVRRVRVKVTKSPVDMPNVGAVAVECWRTPEDFREAEAS